MSYNCLVVKSRVDLGVLLQYKDSKTTEIYPVRNICYSYFCDKILDRYFYKLSGISNGVYTKISNKYLGKIKSALDLMPKRGLNDEKN